MHSSHKQVGRSRVNKVREGKNLPPKSRELNKKDGLVHYRPRSSVIVETNSYKILGQIKKLEVTGIQKLYELQEVLLSDGMTRGEYEDYIQDKINTDKYYYKNLSEENVVELKNRYKRLVQKKNNKYNEIRDKNLFNRKQRKLYREKRRALVNELKRELINSLFKSLGDSKVNGVSRSTSLLSDDPDKWNDTKLCLFLGGRYIESSDKGWTSIYRKLSSCELMESIEL